MEIVEMILLLARSTLFMPMTCVGPKRMMVIMKLVYVNRMA